MNFLRNKTVISIIWALLIAVLFMKICKGGRCLVLSKPQVPKNQIPVHDGELCWTGEPRRTCRPDFTFAYPHMRHIRKHQAMNPQCTPDADTPLSCYHHHPMDSIYKAPNRSLDNDYVRN